MSKSFKPRFLCSKIHSSPHSFLPKFCAIFWELKLIFFYSFGFQPEQWFQPGLLPSLPAQPRPTSSLPFRPSLPIASPSLTSGPTLSVSPAVFFLRKPDRAPPPAHLPRGTPLPLPWQNESAPLPAHLPDSLFHLPISSPTRNAFTIEAPPAAADSSPPSLRLATPAL
jgi:hypothetical protein